MMLASLLWIVAIEKEKCLLLIISGILIFGTIAGSGYFIVEYKEVLEKHVENAALICFGCWGLVAFTLVGGFVRYYRKNRQKTE